jgi:hypothetical protein
MFYIKYELYEYFLKDDNILIINSIDIEKEVNVLLSQDDDMLSIKKYLDNIWSSIIDSLLDQGSQFFAITINSIGFSYNTNNESDISMVEIEKKRIKNYLYNLYPSTNFFFIVSEPTSTNMLHFHAIISIRNFIDYNYILKKAILIKLLNYKYFDYGHSPSITNFDVKVQSLNFFKDIKNWVMYLHKNISMWKYKGLLSFLSIQEYNFIFNWYPCLSDIYLYMIDNYSISSGGSSVMDIDFLDENLLRDYEKRFNHVRIFCNNIPENYIKNLSLIRTINGIRLTYNKIDQRTLINLLQYYLIFNEYYIYNDNIYVKIKESKISYKIVGGLKDVLYEKFYENVVKYYINNFENYFKGFDFSYLMDSYFIKSKNIIECIKDISTQRIKPDFGLIEFTDGVYSIKYDRFFSNKINYNFSSSIHTIKYYNKSYNWVRQNKPTNWIDGLKNALGINTSELINDDYIRLCLHIINPIHKDIFNKKSTLFIHGVSNTGKTTLVSNVLSEYFGPENIGSIISSRNFKWQDLVGKVLGIIDEGRYNASMSSDLLKITGQENIIVEKKYSKEHIIIKPIPLIILTNILFEDKDMSIDEALKNRLYTIEFIHTISKENLNNSNEFKKRLKDEEANIIVYCNKLLFKTKNTSFKKIGNTITNVKMLKLLEFRE